MNEPAKTMGLATLAVVAVVWAVIATRSAPEVKAKDRVGELLVKIEDPLLVSALKIARFDESTGKVVTFEVTKTKSGYVIPSHENYPADAKKHLADAAVSVNDLRILSYVGDSKQLFEQMGVLDPSEAGLKLGATGVGTRVTLSSDGRTTLADFIIGKETANRAGMRYVRLADKDQVYTVKIDTQYLTTQFDDWIEKDLLRFDPLDLKQVTLADYSIETEQRMVQFGGKLEPVSVPVAINNRSAIDLSYDPQSLKWVLDKLAVFKQRKESLVKLSADEQLNDQRLNDLKTALEDLKIADVRRKPNGLAGDVADFIAKNPDALKSLVTRGFYPMEATNPATGKEIFQVLCDQGEVIVRMVNGVEYVLRFGGVAGGEAAADQANAKQPGKNKGPDDDKAKGTKLLRYLFVMTRFNENIVAKPVLEKLPADPPAEDKKGDAKDESGKDDKAVEKKDNEKKDNAEKAKDEKAKQDPDKGDAKKDGAADAKKSDAKKPDDKKPEAKDPPKKDPAELKAERDRIVKDNERKQKEYTEKLESGKKRVADLNKRFADWYYIISDATYQKIHLGQKDVIQKKPKDAKHPGDVVPPLPTQDPLQQFQNLKEGIDAGGEGK